MTSKEDILKFIGLIKRAGKTCAGKASVVGAMYKGNAALLIISKDTSGNTVSKILDAVEYEIPMYRFSTMEELGHALGEPPRGVIAITDKGFAAALDKKLTDYVDEED